jgi:opacity protein-like surface antigen
VSARRIGHAALIALVVFASSRLGQADSVLVMLGEPAQGSAAKNEIVNRVRGELIADGFRVQPLPAVPEADRESALRQAGRAAGEPIAAGFFVDEDTSSVDIYLLDTRSERLDVRRVDVHSSSDARPEVVARHAVDVMRANLLEFAIASLRPAAPTEPSAAPSPPRREPVGRPTLARWAIEGGLGVLSSFAGVGAAIVPTLGLRLASNRTFQIRLIGAGLGSTPTVKGAGGTATVQQGVVLVDGAATLGHARWLQPLVGIGAGAYDVSVNGTGAQSFQGRSGNAWALALDGAVGVAASVTSNVQLSLEAHALVTEPGIRVRFTDVVAASLGRPTLLVLFTVAGWI